MRNELHDMLLATLSSIAQVSGGYATLVDRGGRRIKTVDSSGQEHDGLIDLFYPEAKIFWEKNEPGIMDSQLEEGAKVAILPLGDYILVISNVERIREEKNLKKEFEKALPLIAKVAGGEAVLFDHTGLRFATYGPDGNPSQRVGEISKLGQRAMEYKQPVFGPSNMVEGATVVCAPINTKFGFGFNNILSVSQKQRLIESVRKKQTARYNFDDIVGNSITLQKVKREAESIASSNSTVFLYGESGTGKELFAQSIHNASLRSGKPFIALNCGAIPTNLVESTFFGYESGSFTGAKSGGQEGVFEQANGGTIFLDEISEMDISIQTRLLRVLQEREVVRIGGRRSIRVDVRVISSSNRDLKQMVSERKFRQDLYYRLNVIELWIPPLRERKDDIYPLVNHFIYTFNNLFGKRVRDISGDALDRLTAYDWPGNVRELKNCIERIMNVVIGDVISVNDIPLISNSVDSTFEERPTNQLTLRESQKSTLDEAISGITKSNLVTALKDAHNNRQIAAKTLGISTTTLWRKMKKYNLL